MRRIGYHRVGGLACLPMLAAAQDRTEAAKTQAAKPRQRESDEIIRKIRPPRRRSFAKAREERTDRPT